MDAISLGLIVSLKSTNNASIVEDENRGYKPETYGNHALKITGNYQSNGYATQKYQFADAQANHKDELYTLGAWVKVNGSKAKDNRTVGILVNEYFNDEFEGETIGDNIASITYDNSISEWQYMMVTFRLNSDAAGFQIALSYNNQLGDVEFDGVTLYKSSLSSFVGDDPMPTTCPCENCSEPDCPCACESEEACNCIWCKRGTTTVENDYGLTTKETTTDATTSMESTYTYDSNNYYLTESTDVNGNTVYYEYDSNTGKLTSMAAGNQNDKINYTYNAVGLLKTVSQTVTNIVTGEEVNMLSEYTYDGDSLKQISHNGSVYSFEYDNCGNVSNVKIGSQSLAQYSFNDIDQLGYILYGNGDRINYEYDSNGNITSVSTQMSGEETDTLIEYTYSYNADGKLLSYTDNVNGTVTSYTDSGYTISIPSNDENTEDTVIYSTVTSDDTRESTVNLFGYEFNTKKYTNAYDIKTGQTRESSQYTLPCETLGITGIGNSVTVTDYYGKDISSTFKLHTDDIIADDTEHINQYDYSINNSYTYVSGENNITSNLVKTYTSEIKLHYNLSAEEQAEIDAAIENNEMTQEDVDELYAGLNQTIKSLTTSYEYDSAGRITKICRNTQPLALYKYDEAGQLTEEINYEIGTICRYTYDEGGNITSKVYYNDVEYNEENGTFIYREPTNTLSYSYDNTQWGDLLTNYNGLDINYDKIGNPLNYKGINYFNQENIYNLKWNGRLLTEVTYNNEKGEPAEKYIYSYNADGLRTKKERYIWDSDKKDYTLYQISEYVWENNRIVGFKIDYNGLSSQANGEIPYVIVLPLYDENEEIIGVAYKSYKLNTTNSDTEMGENVFYFIKDAQGNIISMFDPLNNDYTVEYYYNAYGSTKIYIPAEENKVNNMPTGTFLEQLAKGLAVAGLRALYSLYKEINPFMYRGYFYDGETGLYYNQSRYYSGEWGRFINADDPMITDTGTGTPNANNVFIYCENDCVNNIDPDGTYYKVIGKTVRKNKHFKIPLTDWISTSGNPTITWTKSKSVSASISGNISGTIYGIGLSIGATSSFSLTASSSYQWNVSSKKGKKARIVAYVDAYQYYINQISPGYMLVMKKVGRIYLCSFVYTIRNSYGYFYSPIKNSQLISIEYIK